VIKRTPAYATPAFSFEAGSAIFDKAASNPPVVAIADKRRGALKPIQGSLQLGHALVYRGQHKRSGRYRRVAGQLLPGGAQYEELPAELVSDAPELVANALN
jgi:hypothetical protein